ncbi:MAG TPA: DNA-binding domain-containing protein [Hyphomicrobiaceae bacterium]|nr:DNA-binding domain-containing protein [Hyphomicrobiaceae bacterium]
MQDKFVTALRHDGGCPDGIKAPTGVSAGQRFNVYKNNSMVALIDALGATYPVVRQLVGEEFFHAIARTYASAHLPETPVMLSYGEAFSSFIETFAPAASVPFLADVGRLEWAWNKAYHAPDLPPVGISGLAALPAAGMALAKLQLHPSVTAFSSGWPAVSIWAAHQSTDTVTRTAALEDIFRLARDQPQPEAALVVRPGLDVDVRAIDRKTSNFIRALQSGANLGEAAEVLVAGDFPEASDTEEPDAAAFLPVALELLFSSGAVAAVVTPGACSRRLI